MACCINVYRADRHKEIKMDTKSSDIQAGLSSMGLYVVAGQTAIFVTQTCLGINLPIFFLDVNLPIFSIFAKTLKNLRSAWAKKISLNTILKFKIK